MKRWRDFLAISGLSIAVAVLGEPPLSLFVAGAGAATAVFAFVRDR